MSANANTIEDRWLNPAVLKWAREWRGRTLEEAASKAKKDVRVIEAWESGEKTPTVKQARDLAAYYDRPFLEFLLPEPPELPRPTSLPDFRMHRDVQPPSNDWDFQAELRWVESQRTNALDLYDEIGESPPEFPRELFASLNDSAEQKADLTRSILQFPIERQVQLTRAEADKLPGLLRNLIESIGVLTLRRTSLASLKVRGICLAEFPLPTIVYTSETQTAQAFSLMHEFGHVLLKESGVSGASDRTAGTGTVEGWCNRFAAAFLMPEPYVAILAGPLPHHPAPTIEDSLLASYAKSLRVSPHAMLIRLVQLGYVERSYYWDVKKPEYDNQEAVKQGGGKPEYYGVRYRSTQGDLYTGLVLEAWSMDRITNHKAGEFMGIKNMRHTTPLW